MINRRTAGVATLHTLLLAAEAALLWVGVAILVTSARSIEFTTLLPLPAYPIAIAFSLMFSLGVREQLDASVVSPGWANAMRLAFRQVLAVAAAVFTLAVGMKDPGISRIFLAAYLATVGVAFVVLNRFQPRWVIRLLYGRAARLPTLILGDASLFPQFQSWLAVHERFGVTPVGLVTYRGTVPAIEGLEVLGDFTNLKEAISRSGAQQVLMLSLPASAEDSEALARVCAGCGCRLLIHNNLTFRLSYPLRLLMQDGYSFLAFQDEPLEDPINRGLKRLLDIGIAVPVVLFVLPPLAVLVWLMQRRQSPGPLFYFQARSGRFGRSFRIVKFRTMHPGAVQEGPLAPTPDDRIFSFGRLLRRTSLDEVPQFLNVLRGDMSVVGPRPHFVRQDDVFASEVNEYRVRFLVKPGITGLAQSRGFRGEMRTPDAIQDRIQLDLHYIHTWSVWLDIAIVARTFSQVINPPSTAR